MEKPLPIRAGEAVRQPGRGPTWPVVLQHELRSMVRSFLLNVLACLGADGQRSPQEHDVLDEELSQQGYCRKTTGRSLRDAGRGQDETEGGQEHAHRQRPPRAASRAENTRAAISKPITISATPIRLDTPCTLNRV